MTGRPKPTQLKIAEGDRRRVGKGTLQRRLEAEPIAQRGLGDAPAHLCALARQMWDFWRLELELMQLDSRPDRMILEGACVAYARAVAADTILHREGLIVRETVLYKGVGLQNVERNKKHPAIAVSNAAWTLVKAFCSELGLSPLSRTRLAIERKPDPDADINADFNGPRLTAEERKRLQ